MTYSSFKSYWPRVALLLLFSALTAAGSYALISKVTETEQYVTQTNRVIESLDELISELKDAETGQRGYLLTGESNYLEPYHSAFTKIQSSLEKCRTALQDSPVQMAEFHQVDQDIARKLIELEVAVARRRTLGFESALSLVKSGIGEALMERIRASVSAIQRDERKLLEARLINQRHMRLVIGGFISFLVAFLLASFVSLSMEIRSRQAAQERLRVAFEQLQSSEERFRLLAEGAKDYALYWLDLDGNVSTWTPAAERIKGYKAEEIVGSHISRFYLPDDVAAGKPKQLLSTALIDGRSEVEGWQRKKDGSPFWAQVLVTVMKDANGVPLGFSKLVRDITEHKNAQDALRQKEQELVQSRKLEAIGRLAGGVAHDFNNLMTGIVGVCEELIGDAKMASRKQDLQEIMEAANRATLLTKQLLAFGRRQIAAPIVLNLNDLIVDMQKMLQRMIGEDVEFITFLNPGLGNVRADPGQLEQIIINLAINARDAMPQGGKITIETDNIELTDDQTKKHFDLQAGRYVSLIFSDTGSGIAPEIQSHIFEPFFTTKEKGKGTGLGLATVYGIIKQNGGDIFLYSHPGQGTTFKIYLPRDSSAMPAEHTKAVVGSVQGGTETILLVEDEDLVRRVAFKALTKYGYRVLEAHHGPEALEISNRFPDPIHLLLTDVVMPEMSGRQLAERLVSIRPNLKILYMSGYTENIIVHRGILKPGISFIEKSFTSSALCRKVRDVLDTSKAVQSS